MEIQFMSLKQAPGLMMKNIGNDFLSRMILL